MQPLSSYTLADPKVMQNPYPYYERLRAEDPEYMQREGFLLLDPADSFKLDGELHTRRRKLVAHAFTGPAVTALEARVAGASGNRDPQRFAEPDQFNPDRTNTRQHLAFGTGVHFCLCSMLARQEMKCAVKGAYGDGAIFAITPSGQESVLYSFNASANDGFRPGSGVIQASDGNLYGTTPGNGSNVNKDYGAVFKVTLSGQETLVYTFQGITASDGQLPVAGLIQAVDGNLYGTTSEGGTGLSGTVFKLNPAGVETVLSNFNAGGSTSVNGYSPSASLIQASDGNLYGINNLGGAQNDGTVFQVTPQGVTNLVYTFGDNSGDGAGPEANLIQASDGNFYGTTHGGGAYGYGTIFKITPQ